jgi:hypothetical protein
LLGGEGEMRERERERERRNRLRIKKTNAKWKQGCQAFIVLSVTLWTFAVPSEEAVLFTKSIF